MTGIEFFWKEEEGLSSIMTVLEIHQRPYYSRHRIRHLQDYDSLSREFPWECSKKTPVFNHTDPYPFYPGVVTLPPKPISVHISQDHTAPTPSDTRKPFIQSLLSHTPELLVHKPLRSPFNFPHPPRRLRSPFSPNQSRPNTPVWIIHQAINRPCLFRLNFSSAPFTRFSGPQ